MLTRKFFSLKLAVLLCLQIILEVSSVINLADVPCGLQKRDERSPKIVSGFLSKPHTYHGEFPWMVSIKFKEGNHFCGGFVINRNFILSAAHCFDSITEKFAKLSMMKATVGEHHHHEKEEPVDAIDINFSKIIRHFQYDQYNLSHDIALLKLETALEWSPFVQPLCLPDTTAETKMSHGTIAGWGRTGETEPPSDVLLQATVPILDNSKCQQFFNIAQFKFLVNTFQFCAGRFFGGVDTCLGDSGGPLMVRQKISAAEQMTALGIVSLGKGCGRVALPGIYTKVANYVPWIKDQISSH